MERNPVATVEAATVKKAICQATMVWSGGVGFCGRKIASTAKSNIP